MAKKTLTEKITQKQIAKERAEKSLKQAKERLEKLSIELLTLKQEEVEEAFAEFEVPPSELRSALAVFRKRLNQVENNTGENHAS